MKTSRKARCLLFGKRPSGPELGRTDSGFSCLLSFQFYFSLLGVTLSVCLVWAAVPKLSQPWSWRSGIPRLETLKQETRWGS